MLKYDVSQEKQKRRRPFPGTRARVICIRHATLDTRLVENKSKSKKLAKSRFNKWVLLRISVRIRCPIPNCPKSHIRHTKKQKNECSSISYATFFCVFFVILQSLSGDLQGGVLLHEARNLATQVSCRTSTSQTCRKIAISLGKLLLNTQK